MFLYLSSNSLRGEEDYWYYGGLLNAISNIVKVAVEKFG